MKKIAMILIIFCVMIGINFAITGCGDVLSPDFDLDMAGRDLTPPNDDNHKGINGSESCGTAVEKGGCHSGTIEF